MVMLISDGNYADIRLVQLMDKPHVAEDGRVAHMIKGVFFLFAFDERPTDCRVYAFGRRRRGRPYEGDVEILGVNRSARVGRIGSSHRLLAETRGSPTRRSKLRHWPCRSPPCRRHGRHGRGVIATCVAPRVASAEFPLKTGLPDRNGSMISTDLPVSMRKADWPTTYSWSISFLNGSMMRKIGEEDQWGCVYISQRSRGTFPTDRHCARPEPCRLRIRRKD